VRCTLVLPIETQLKSFDRKSSVASQLVGAPLKDTEEKRKKKKTNCECEKLLAESACDELITNSLNFAIDPSLCVLWNICMALEKRENASLRPHKVTES
jgi:hypothetical protein